MDKEVNLYHNGGSALKPDELAEKLVKMLNERAYFFSELLREFCEVEYRTFLLAWSVLRTKYQLKRDKQGRYLM
jgi:hypothetical protein